MTRSGFDTKVNFSIYASLMCPPVNSKRLTTLNAILEQKIGIKDACGNSDSGGLMPAFWTIMYPGM